MYRTDDLYEIVHRLAGVELLQGGVEAGQGLGGEGQIGVGGRIGEADFDALALGARAVRDAAGGRAVAGRIGQQHMISEARRNVSSPASPAFKGQNIGLNAPDYRNLDNPVDHVVAGLGPKPNKLQRQTYLPPRQLKIDAVDQNGSGMNCGRGEELAEIAAVRADKNPIIGKRSRRDLVITRRPEANMNWMNGVRVAHRCHACGVCVR